MKKKVDNKILENLKSTSRKKMENAFNIIFEEYASLVYYVALKILRSKSDAEDITNETFLKFYENKKHIHYAKNIKYYLLTTSKNLSLNLSIKKRKEVPLDDNEVIEENKIDYFNDYLEKFKDFLNEEEIDIVIYHMIYGFKFKEIANMKNVSVNVISSKYKRILEKVKIHYKKGE